MIPEDQFVTDTDMSNIPEIKKAEKDQNTSDNGEPNVNTDGRDLYHWESGYPPPARDEIRLEAIYISLIFLIALIGLLFTWSDLFWEIMGIEEVAYKSLTEIGIYFFSGLLGGTVFGIKYFYRVVARGYWSQDRRYWRLFSPWISACIALIVGCMVLSGYLNATKTPSDSVGVCVGFIAGYFADEAVGKMSEVAVALFGTNSARR